MNGPFYLRLPVSRFLDVIFKSQISLEQAGVVVLQKFELPLQRAQLFHLLLVRVDRRLVLDNLVGCVSEYVNLKELVV